MCITRMVIYYFIHSHRQCIWCTEWRREEEEIWPVRRRSRTCFKSPSSLSRGILRIRLLTRIWRYGGTSFFEIEVPVCEYQLINQWQTYGGLTVRSCCLYVKSDLPIQIHLYICYILNMVTGHPDLTFNKNVTLVILVQDYIKNTKRFSS